MTPAQPLFDPRQFEPKTCPACGTTRKNLCRYSADLRDGQATGKRPKGCLDRYDPHTAPLPEGY